MPKTSNIQVNVIRGRAHTSGENDPPLCAKSKESNLLSKCGLSVYSNLCNSNCDLKDSCPYLSQFKENAQVRIFPHARLPLSRGFLDSKLPDAAIVDESFYQTMIHSYEYSIASLEDIKRFIANKKLRNIIVESLEDKLPLLENLRKSFSEDVDQTLSLAAIEVSPKFDFKNLDKDSLLQELESIENIRERRVLSQMLNQLSVEISLFPDRKKSITVRYSNNDKTVFVASRHEMTRFTKRNSEGVDNKIPVLLIDADYRQKIGKIFFPSIRFKKIRVERNAYVTQVSSATNARRRFKLSTKASKKQKAALEKHLAETANIIHGIHAKYGKTLVVAYKFLNEVSKHDIPGLKQRLEATPDIVFAHFGDLRGSNDYEDCEAVVVIGRQQIGSITIENQAASLWWDSDRTLILNGKLKQESRGYRLRSGKRIGVKVDVCADKRSQMLLELQRECETLQALDRIRLIHNPQPKRIFLLSKLPLDIDVDKLISLPDLKNNKSPNQELFEKAFSLAPNNVLPINPSQLMADYPDIFSTKKITNNAIKKEGFAGTWQTLNLINIAMNYSDFNLVEFSAKGKSKLHFKALVPREMAYNDVVNNLRRIYDADIIIKNVLFKQHDIQFAKPIPNKVDMIADEYFYADNKKLRYDHEWKAWCLDYE